MDRITFTVFGKPASAGSKKSFWKKGKMNYVPDDDNALSWRGQVIDAARKAYCGPLLDGPLKLICRFYRPRIQGHFRKDGSLRDNAPDYPATIPDLTKLVRGIEDALNGLVWKDDSRVVWQENFKLWGEPVRAEVVIETLP